MNAMNKTAIALLALGASALMAIAQDNGAPSDGQRPPRREGPGGPGMRGRLPLPPVMAVLDANHDGVIDEAEIANSATALKALDKNGDGKLTQEELRPQRPQRPQGENEVEPDGPRGPRGEGNRPGNMEGRRPLPPVMAALDANHDRVIDETELANAPTALKALDKDSDGKLSQEELRPPRPEGPGRRGPRGPQPPPDGAQQQ